MKIINCWMYLKRIFLPILSLSFIVGFSFLVSCSDHSQQVQGYIEGYFINFSSSASGILKKLAVVRGDQVKAEQLLFILDPEPEQSTLISARAKLQEAEQNLNNLIAGQRFTILQGITAQYKQAEADLLYARQTLTRYQTLIKTGAIDKATVDRAVSDYNAKKEKLSEISANLAEAKQGSRQHLILAQEAVVAEAKADIKKDEWQLAQKTQHATGDGQIFDTYFREGEYVPAGQTITSLLTPDNIQLIFYVPEPLLSQLKIRSAVYFNCDGCQKTKAVVYYISSQAEYTPPVIYSRESREKLVYRVEATIAPGEAVKFHAGQPVDVTIPTNKNK